MLYRYIYICIYNRITPNLGSRYQLYLRVSSDFMGRSTWGPGPVFQNRWAGLKRWLSAYESCFCCSLVFWTNSHLSCKIPSLNKFRRSQKKMFLFKPCPRHKSSNFVNKSSNHTIWSYVKRIQKTHVALWFPNFPKHSLQTGAVRSWNTRIRQVKHPAIGSQANCQI